MINSNEQPLPKLELLKKIIKDNDIKKLAEIIEHDSLPSIINPQNFIKEIIKNDSVKIFEYLSTIDAKIIKFYQEVTLENMLDAITHNKIECVKYFAEHYEHKFKYAAEYYHNMSYTNAIKNDSLETIEFTHNYLISLDKDNQAYSEMFKRCIQFDAKKTLDYCISNNVLLDKDVVKNAVFLSMWFERNDILDLIIEKTNFNIQYDLDEHLFVNVLHAEKLSKTMFYIVEKYDFYISEEIRKSIDDVLNEPFIPDSEKENMRTYIKYVESYHLNKKLGAEMKENKNEKNVKKL